MKFDSNVSFKMKFLVLLVASAIAADLVPNAAADYDKCVAAAKKATTKAPTTKAPTETTKAPVTTTAKPLTADEKACLAAPMVPGIGAVCSVAFQTKMGAVAGLADAYKVIETKLAGEEETSALYKKYKGDGCKKDGTCPKKCLDPTNAPAPNKTDFPTLTDEQVTLLGSAQKEMKVIMDKVKATDPAPMISGLLAMLVAMFFAL